MATRRQEFLAGMRAELPLLLGVFPFGMIYGVLALQSGAPAGAAQAMSAIIFGGSSQFVAAQLLSVSAPGAVIVVTVAIVNLRHALYSASLAPFLRRLPARWKWILAYLLTDEAYAPTVLHYNAERPNPEAPDYRHWFFLGAGLTLWSTWQISTAAGILLGVALPASWSLDFTLALTFIALLVPALKDRAGVGAALAAGITALLAFGLPLKLGLMLAALVGVGVGMALEGPEERRERGKGEEGKQEIVGTTER